MYQVHQIRAVKCHLGHRWRCTSRFCDCIRVLDWRHMDTESWVKKIAREKEKFCFCLIDNEMNFNSIPDKHL